MDFVNIIGTLYDNSINHIVALAHQIKDLRLNKNQQDINEELFETTSQYNSKIEHLEESEQSLQESLLNINQELNTLSEQTTQNFSNINQEIEELKTQRISEEVINQINQSIEEGLEEVNTRISQVEQNSSNSISEINQDISNINQNISGFNVNIQDLVKQNIEINQRLDNIKNNEFKHIILTQSQYDNLQSYEKNTIYLIVEEREGYSVFGDTFPFILGGASSRFGDTFPLIFN